MFLSEDGVAVGLPVSGLLQVPFQVDRRRPLKNFIRGALLPGRQLAGHLVQRQSIPFFPLAASLDDTVAVEQLKCEMAS